MMAAALLLIILLWCLSMAGAFLGAQKARLFFNSIPLIIYWWALSSLIILGLLIFSRLTSKPALLLIHAGCILVLLGAMWSSQTGHQLQKKYLDIDKIPEGYLFLYEGRDENCVVSDQLVELGKLPFYLRLNDFRIDYYWADGLLRIETKNGEKWEIPDQVGQGLDLPDDLPRLKIVRRFRNFRIDLQQEPVVAYDDPQAMLGYNPALEIELEGPDGRREIGYVFAQQAGHTFPTDKFTAVYDVPTHPLRDIRDYYSDLTVFDGDQILARRIIEVNHPLHYGGYHFYQSNYDNRQGQYTVLSVTSDTGLTMVYVGYFLLCLGVFWQLWLRHILTYFKKSRFAVLGEAENLDARCRTSKSMDQ